MAVEVETVQHDANSKLPKGHIPSESTALGSSIPTSMRCPDPSAHHATKSASLQDQASAAALYSTRKDMNLLGPDGRLSSASAATSLRHARANELPSFPIVGIDTRSSANTAANLANSNFKSPEIPKIESSAAAGKAALLAHDYKMAPAWQPEASTAGSKAALLAHKSGPNLNLWQPAANPNGNTAATLAMKKQALAPVLDSSHEDDGKKKALLAAALSVRNSGRKRAQSTPVQPPLFPDSENSARNALNAATMVHAASMRANSSHAPPVSPDSNRLGSGAMEAARIQHSKSISRDMYTSTPPVALEVEEKRRQDALRASAISMAKKMYDVQQHQIDQAARTSRSHAQSGATAAHDQQGGEPDIKEQAMRYIGVQEAAQKLAAERLAKIGPDDNAKFRSYYGYESPGRSKLSIRGRTRTRASSNPETGDSDDDEFQSRRIRSQMSQFNKSLAEVDAKKQQEDRRYLLAAAQRKVQAQMLGMDKKIFDETGKMSPAMIDEWDAKAKAKAAAASEARMENHGKIHIGNGKYMDQADIDAVALARVQPTLNEIAEKTEKRLAEEEERRLEREEKKREQQKEKEKAAELKAEERRIKDEEKKATKARNAEEKAAAKQLKEAGKEKKTEEQQLAKEEKQKSKETGKGAVAVPATDTTSRTTATPAENKTEDNEDLYRSPTPPAAATAAAAHTASEPDPINPKSPLSPTSPTSPTTSTPTSPKTDSKGLKSFLNKLKRRSRRTGESAEAGKAGFIGGNTLRESSSTSHRDSAPASPDTCPTHIPEPDDRFSSVSSVSTGPISINERGRPQSRTSGKVSAVSSVANEDFDEARDEFDEKLAPPRHFTSSVDDGRKGSPVRDSKFHEVGI